MHHHDPRFQLGAEVDHSLIAQPTDVVHERRPRQERSLSGLDAMGVHRDRCSGRHQSGDHRGHSLDLDRRQYGRSIGDVDSPPTSTIAAPAS